MIDQLLSLAKRRLQVFYFAMDDHVKNLLLKTGNVLGYTSQSVG
jgi:hypothetical protein